MAHGNSLQVLLAVRRRMEERQEQALAEVSQQMARGSVRLQEITEELMRVVAEHRTGTSLLLAGWQHQEAEKRIRNLQMARAQGVSEVNRMREVQRKQMALYVEARGQREVVSELQAQRSAAHQAQLTAREQKALEDLFLCRKRD